MESEQILESTDKMLDIEEGPTVPDLKPVDLEKKQKLMLQQQKLYEVMKALTAMKLTKEDKNPGAVFPDLFLGSIGAAYNKEVLTELGITHILTCAANIRPRFEEVSLEFNFYLCLQDYKYLQLPCLDSPNQNILTHVDLANKFIREAISENVAGEEPKNKVLIHCFAGKSRATSFLLAHMIKEKGINLKDGLEMIWKVRPIAAPNPGFMIQLKALEKNSLGVTSECEVMQGMWKEKLDALKK